MEKTNNSAQSFENLLNNFINENVPTEQLIEIGRAFKLNQEDWLEISRNIKEKDITPLLSNLKTNFENLKKVGNDSVNYFDKLKNNFKQNGIDAALSELKKDGSHLVEDLTTATKQLLEDSKSILPEAKSRIINFCDSIVNDYSKLETDEEKGRYILRLALLTVLFSYAFYKGNDLPDSDFFIWGAGAHRSFLSHSAIPMVIVSIASTVIVRILEQVETKLQDNLEAKKTVGDLKLILNILKLGFGAGLSTHLFIDGLYQTGGTIRIHDLNGKVLGSLVSGTKVDDMAYTTIMALFTKNLSLAQS